MFSPYTWGSKGGGRPARTPPSPDAPDITVGPADALGQPRNPSSAASTTGGHTVQDNVPDNDHSDAAAASGLADVINACLAYIISIIQVLAAAGGSHGQLHVLQFVKHLLELLAVNGLDADTECLVEAAPADNDRKELLESFLMALSTEDAPPAGIVAQLVEIVKDCNISGEPAACAAPESPPPAQPMIFHPKNPDTPTVTIRAYDNIFRRFLQR